MHTSQVRAVMSLALAVGVHATSVMLPVEEHTVGFPKHFLLIGVLTFDQPGRVERREAIRSMCTLTGLRDDNAAFHSSRRREGGAGRSTRRRVADANRCDRQAHLRKVPASERLLPQSCGCWGLPFCCQARRRCRRSTAGHDGWPCSDTQIDLSLGPRACRRLRPGQLGDVGPTAVRSRLLRYEPKSQKASVQQQAEDRPLKLFKGRPVLQAESYRTIPVCWRRVCGIHNLLAQAPGFSASACI